MAKKMLAFLGTSEYKTCIYAFEDGNKCETSFVQTALANFLKPFDEVVVFATDEAKKKNWDKLKQAADSQCPEFRFVRRKIKEGKNTEEIWETFETLMSCIHDGDEIVFDITHSFRSIPFLALACAQYVRSLRNISLSGIFYGAYEARQQRDQDPFPTAPIFDLTPFVELMDWSRGVSDFIHYGESGPINALARKETGGMAKKLGKNLRTVVDSLFKLQNEIATCRGRLIYEGNRLSQIEPNLKKLKKNAEALPPPFLPIMERLADKIEDLKGFDKAFLDDDIQRGFGAVKWCLDHNLVQQAYTLLQENLITYFCRAGGLDPFKKDPDRKLAGQAAKVHGLDESEWEEPSRSHVDSVRRIHEAAGGELLGLFENLSDDRNDINHGGIVQTTKPSTLKTKIEENFENIRKNLKNRSQIPF